MDDINILLSEVAFELLGNKFYDIYGVQHETLQQLMTSEKTTAPEGYIEKTCPLLEAVTADISDDEPEHQFEVPALKPGKRNRRASATDVFEKPIAMETITINDPESLLMPMERGKKGGAGRISRRRFTVMESNSSNGGSSMRNRHSLTAKQITASKGADFFTPPAPLPPKKAAINRTPADVTKELTPVQSEKAPKDPDTDALAASTSITMSITDKVNELKARTAQELQRLMDDSERDRLNYFLTNRDLLGTSPYHSEFEIIEEFHKGEKDRFMFTCNQLIEFIKFIKVDEDYKDRMGYIAKCILQLKDSM